MNEPEQFLEIQDFNKPTRQQLAEKLVRRNVIIVLMTVFLMLAAFVIIVQAQEITLLHNMLYDK